MKNDFSENYFSPNQTLRKLILNPDIVAIKQTSFSTTKKDVCDEISAL